MRKWDYWLVIQQKADFLHWDDLEEFETNSTWNATVSQRSEILHLMKEYRMAHPHLPLRLIARRRKKQP
jgi:hypothetical protein